MSSFHHIQHSHLHPDPETNHDDHQVSHLIPFFPLYDPSPSPSPSPSSFPYHSTLSLHSSQPSDVFHQQLHHQDVEISQSGGSTDDPLLFVLHPPQAKEVDRDRDRDLDHDDRHTPRSKNNNGGSVKWMSSKMRLMRKMMNSDASSIQSKPQRRNVQSPLQEQEEHHPAGIVRVCSDCNTTKTPLWRSGPQGPKSLCNACGIRQRKARKAMAAAAAAAVNSSSSSSTGSDEQLVKHEETKNDGSNLNHEEKVDVGRVPQIVPLKKRCRYATTVGANDANAVDRDSETGMGAQNNTQLRQVFPQDETKEAAILLMALSSDLACR